VTGKGSETASALALRSARRPRNSIRIDLGSKRGMAKAQKAYQDLLTLWKDADPDIPVLKQAKAEYAKL
jgi:hypothetical protein